MSVNFTQDEPGELIGGSRFKPVDQFLLPKVEHAMHFYKSLCIQVYSQSVTDKK